MSLWKSEYNSGMHIVIPGALPSANVAGELARLLPQRAPTLHAWLQAATAHVDAIDVRTQGCSPYEAWQLENAHFRPTGTIPLGAGLGPLIAGPSVNDSEPVWLAELCHLSLGADQAVLLDPSHMDIQEDESLSLLASVRDSLDAAGYSATFLSPQRWRLSLPADLHPVTASPATVIGQPLRNWWSQDAGMRPWRRLLNEIQMVWYDHPANDSRAARGLPPVNALWLYGGAPSWPEALQSTLPGAQRETHLLTDLEAAHRNEDWGTWIDRLADIDQYHLRSLASPRGVPLQSLTLDLFGVDRRVTLTVQPRSRLLSWLPAPKKNWNSWWSHPA